MLEIHKEEFKGMHGIDCCWKHPKQGETPG